MSKVDAAAQELTEANERLRQLRESEETYVAELDTIRENIVMHKRKRNDALKVLSGGGPW